MVESDDLVPLIASVRALTESVGKLQSDASTFHTESIEQLASATRNLELQARINSVNIAQGKRRTLILVAFVMVAFLLTGGLGFTITQVNANNRDIAEIQEVTSNEVLCPLYDLILSAKDRPPKDLTPEQLAERIAAYVIIQRGYDALKC